MNVIIDTNILYYISNLYESKKYNSPVLLKFLKENYDTILISDYTILEINTKFYENRDKIRTLINFMYYNKIGVYLNLKPEHQIINEKTINNLVDLDFFNKHIEDSVNKRKEIELSYISFFLSAISSLYLGNKFEEKKITNISEDLKEKLFCFFYESTLDQGSTRKNISNIITKKYRNGSDKEFNDSIIELIVENCIELYLLLEFAQNEINIFDAINNKLSIEKQTKLQDIYNEPEFNRLQKRNQKTRALIKKEFAKILKNSLNYFEEKLAENIPQTQLKYFVNLFSGILLSKDKVIRKNDILDSLIASNYPNEIFLTADNNLQNRIKEIYPEYEKLLNTTLYTCKKTL